MLQRPYTSKQGTGRLARGHSSLLTRSTQGGKSATSWMMSRPLRHQSRNNKQFQSEHVIDRSKIKVADLTASNQPTIEDVIGSYHASKLHKLLHKPRIIRNPTIYYKTGENMKTKQEAIFEKSPQRPINLMNENGRARFNAIMLEHAQQRKQEQYGNLMKQLYKIKSKLGGCF